jgi:UPF0271 protein
MNLRVDLNADLGEGAAGEPELLRLISSASIACGFHAGNVATMSASVVAARQAGVAVGAHPSLADRENFGRIELPVTPEEVFQLVAYQVGAFDGIARSLGVRPNHVKPHGALYNMAVRDQPLSDAIARAVFAVDPSLALFAPNDSALAEAATGLGLRVTHEVFADRNYLPDGTLVPRSRPDALLHNADEAAERVLRMLHENHVRAIDGSDVAVKAETICLHGDKPEAVAFAHRLRAKLLASGIAVAAPGEK